MADGKRKHVSQADIWEILTTPLSVSTNEIAEKMGIPAPTVWVTRTLGTKKAEGVANIMRERGDPLHVIVPNGGRKLTDDQVREVRATNESSAAVAKRMGVSASTIRMIRTGKTHTSVEDK